MILRKPFAFLIKHFKLIHFILFLFMCYIMYSSSSILSFYNEYLNSSMVLINHEVTITLYNSILTLSFIFTFIITIIVMGLMFMKQKPIKFYLFNILTYIFTLVVLIISKNTLNTLELSLVEVRTIKLIQDLVVMTIIVQGIMCTVAVIRATGFNIKKFDFVKDLSELNIEEEDSEEFEVNVELESDKYLRKIRKFIRYFKYLYVENKYLFSIIGGFLFGIVCLIVYLNLNVYNKTYKTGDMFTTNEFYFSITDTYLTSKDYKGNIIDKNYSFVVAKIKLRTYSSLEKILSIGRISLTINDNNFYHTRDYKTEFSDLGIYYNENTINNQFSEYILVFKIPNSYTDDKMIIKYFDNNFKNIKTSIYPQNLDENKIEKNYSIGQKISFDDSILKKSTLFIEKAEMQSSFKISYDFCLNNNCIVSYENIKPLLNTTIDKALIKIKGTYEIDDKLSINKPYKLYDFIEKFGSIIYKINDNEHIISNITEVMSSKVNDVNTIYLEVPNMVLFADEVKLKIKVRNYTYIYNLK